ncbi:MAG: bifunctional folylpolyglutamate synthase/dihydrofolate synthase [Flavisolibacter sp.]|nr:bifunctional folylpolyglutamate synthase/dihydrofolate synthase [Flavisolibacter sp.]
MNYSETIDYLFSKLPMFSRMGSAAYKKDVTNIIRLCSYLGNPHQQFKSIHVGGTNGKGSVSHMLAAILQTSGYKTGLYTSPHLYDFRERIRINGTVIEEAFVVQFVEQIKPLIEELQPSFFEITVAMAFAYFAREKVAIAVVEVGLGGRLDSTNIITPELSVITNISLDHTNILGATVQEIAFEKAGIIKEGVPVVIGEKKEETAFIFTSVALQKNAPLFFAEDCYSIVNYKLSSAIIELTVNEKEGNERISLACDLPGLYQLKNIVTVLQAVTILKSNYNLSQEIITSSLKNVKSLTGLHGRWEVIQTQPLVIVDVAHNEEGIRQLLQHIHQLSYGKLHLIIGIVKDKDTDTILKQLPSEAAYYFTEAHIPRALPAEMLQQKAEAYHLKGTSYPDVNSALRKAIQVAAQEDLIVVCGSIFLVAEVDQKQFTSIPKLT